MPYSLSIPRILSPIPSPVNRCARKITATCTLKTGCLLHLRFGHLLGQITSINGRAYLIVSNGCNTMKVLEAFDLYRFYHTGDEETLALRGVSIHIEAGEIVVVMGPSGSGKSTLLSCLVGLDEPDGGHVELLGKRLTRKPEAERAAMRAAEIGILLQSRNLFDHLSVTDNMRLQMRLARKFDQQRLDRLIDLVWLTDRRHARPS